MGSENSLLLENFEDSKKKSGGSQTSTPNPYKSLLLTKTPDLTNNIGTPLSMNTQNTPYNNPGNRSAYNQRLNSS